MRRFFKSREDNRPVRKRPYQIGLSVLGVMLQKKRIIDNYPFFDKWSISDSNRPPIDCEPIALPDELIPRYFSIL